MPRISSGTVHYSLVPKLYLCVLPVLRLKKAWEQGCTCIWVCSISVIASLIWCGQSVPYMDGNADLQTWYKCPCPEDSSKSGGGLVICNSPM